MGDVMVDVIVRHAGPLEHGSDTPATTRLTPGGGARNVAAGLTRLGRPAALVACAGDDPLADLALEDIDATQVSRRPDLRTGICVVLVDDAGERTMLPDPGANLALSPPPAGLLRDATTLYVSGYSLLREQTRAAARGALRAARDAGVTTVVDCASAAPLRAATGFLSWMGPVDLLLANEAEAAVLGDCAVDAARALVVKRGSQGASYRAADGAFDVPAAAIENVDTTGAGDAFAAGLLASWHAKPVESALADAVAFAGATLRNRSGAQAV